jgi:hypothetical protein
MTQWIISQILCLIDTTTEECNVKRPGQDNEFIRVVGMKVVGMKLESYWNSSYGDHCQMNESTRVILHLD